MVAKETAQTIIEILKICMATFFYAKTTTESTAFTLNSFFGRVFKMRGDAVFEGKVGWRGATKEHTLHGSATEKQRSQTAFPLKILRTAGL
jgi:hypothetical protein